MRAGAADVMNCHRTYGSLLFLTTQASFFLNRLTLSLFFALSRIQAQDFSLYLPS
jgi:hypothetical protein